MTNSGAGFKSLVPHWSPQHIGHAGLRPLKLRYRLADWGDWAASVRWGQAPEPRQASRPAVDWAAAADRVRAPVGGPQAADCPEASPAAAPWDDPALPVEFRAVRSALQRDLHQVPF